MSDEESFVILGTSPMTSIEQDGNSASTSKKINTLQRDTPPGSCFTSLKNSQINELENAREISDETDTPTKPLPNSGVDPSVSKSSSSNSSGGTVLEKSSDSLLWSRPQIDEFQSPQVSLETKPQVSLETKPQVEQTNDFGDISFEDCAVQSVSTQSPKTSLTSKAIIHPSTFVQNNNKENMEPCQGASNSMTKSQITNGSGNGSKHNSLASSFIMGDVNADVLKSSVFSQFPSISMQASAEDVVKLQNMVTEFMVLKTTLEKVNSTMKLFYENSLQWKEKMNTMETSYKQQLDECRNQIADLRAENTSLKKAIADQVEQTKAVDLARQSDRDEMIKTISEKTSLVENMRAQIVKLEEEHISTFEILSKSPKDKIENGFENRYITRSEHDLEVKDLKRQLSELLASNLDLKDIEKQYIDELNCLKQNLKSSDEIINRTRNEIVILQSLDIEHQKKITELQMSNQELQTTSVQQNERILHLETENQTLLSVNSEQNERISLLEHQNEVHKKDFEMERESRQNAVGEKQKILQDLRALQMRNQQLIEERQKCIDEYERRVSSVSMSSGFDNHTSALTAAAEAAQTYLNNPQRPTRNLPSEPLSPVESSNLFNCPVCNKSFKSISVLTSHVNDCIDKN